MIILISTKKIYIKELRADEMRSSPINNTIGLRFYTVYQTSELLYSYLGKKIFAEYYSIESGKIISKFNWTREMKAFAKEETKRIGPQKSKFKLKIIGYLLVISPFVGIGYIMYENYKMKNTEEKLHAKPKIGDIYYGYRYRDESTSTSPNITYVWAKVTHVIGDTTVFIFNKKKSTQYDNVPDEIPLDFDNKEYKYISQLSTTSSPEFKSIDPTGNFIAFKKK